MRNLFIPKFAPAETYPPQTDGTSSAVTHQPRRRSRAGALALATALVLSGCGEKDLNDLGDDKAVTLNKGAAVKIEAVEGGSFGEPAEVQVEACAGDIKSGFWAGIEDEDKQRGCTSVDINRGDYNKLNIGAPVANSTVTLPQKVEGTVDT